MLRIIVQMLTVIILYHCLPGAQNTLIAQEIKGGIRYDFLLVGNSTQAEAIFVQANSFQMEWSNTSARDYRPLWQLPVPHYRCEKWKSAVF